MKLSIAGIRDVAGCFVRVQLPRNRTVELWEGGSAANITYRLTEPPSSLCKQANCRVYVELDIELGDYPRCRNGKTIVQAVLAEIDDSNEDSTEQDESTSFSRLVTVNNWNINQTVAVVAKLDFKYDGTQVRQLGVWLRQVDEDGETIERRSLAKYKVSCSPISAKF